MVMAEQQELWGVGREGWQANSEGSENRALQAAAAVLAPKSGGLGTTLVRYSYVRIFSEIQKALDTYEGEWEFGIPGNLRNFQPWGDSTEIKGKVEIVLEDKLGSWWLAVFILFCID